MPMIARTKALPTLPTVAARVLAVVADENWSVHDIGDALRVDPSLTSKVIQAANSAQRGLARPLPDIDRAVILLGKRKVSTLALTFSLSSAIGRDKRLAKFYQEYWMESVVQALTAEQLARTYLAENEGQYFTAGLLQDIGRLYLLQTQGDQYAKLIEAAHLGERLLDLERKEFGTTHAELTASMLSEWKFPRQMALAAASHHQLPDVGGQTTPGLTLELALHIAALVGEFFCHARKGLVHVMLEEALSRCPAPRFGADDLMHQVHQRLAAMADVFNFDAGTLPDANEMLAEAMHQIAMMSMSLEEASSAQSVDVLLMRENEMLQSRLREVIRRLQVDPLTGLFTREMLMDRLDRQIQSAAQQNSSVGMLFVDIDHFKQFNDAHGHLAGDIVLRNVSQAIRAAVREVDFAARYGGEEFAIIVATPKRSTIGIIAERIRHAIESQETEIEGCLHSVTASIGAAIIGPVNQVEGVATQLLQASDAAMFQAKSQGRNGIVVVLP